MPAFPARSTASPFTPCHRGQAEHSSTASPPTPATRSRSSGSRTPRPNSPSAASSCAGNPPPRPAGTSPPASASPPPWCPSPPGPPPETTGPASSAPPCSRSPACAPPSPWQPPHSNSPTGSSTPDHHQPRPPLRRSRRGGLAIHPPARRYVRPSREQRGRDTIVAADQPPQAPYQVLLQLRCMRADVGAARPRPARSSPCPSPQTRACGKPSTGPLSERSGREPIRHYLCAIAWHQ